MKNIKYILFSFITIITVVIAVSGNVKANPSLISITSLAQSQGLSNPLAIASSSATALYTTATTTFVTLTDRSDAADLNIYAIASSTNSIINFQIEFSDDYGCYTSPNSCNWYREDANTISGTVVTHAATVMHTWTPGTTSTSTKNITISPIGARFMRIGFAEQTGNSTIWAQVVPKSQTP